MSELLQATAVLLAGIVTALAVRALARARPRLFHRPHHTFTWTVVGLSALGGAFASVAPTGIGGVDVAYRALLAAVITVAAGRARRTARLVSGAIAAIGTAGAWPWNLVAFIALGLATGSASIRRHGRPFAAVIGALQAQVLLRLAWPETSYVTALLAAVAVLVLVVSGVRNARSHERTPTRVALAGVGVVALAVVVLLGVGLFSIQRDLVDGARAADAGLDAMKEGETTLAVDQLERAQLHLGAADDGLRAPWLRPGRLLPVVGRYLDAGQRLTTAAAGVVDPALESARLADGEALRITNARVDLAAVESLRPPLLRTLAAVPEARAAVSQLEAEVLPGPAGRRVRDLDDTLAGAVEDGEFALRLLDAVPQLLGADSPRRYFVVMQTPSEQRASGGIAGGYGELLVEDGHLELVRSGEGNELNRVGRPWELGPLAEEYARFAGTGPEHFFQNMTNVPHFPTVARTIAQVYPQAGGAPVDGVISVDPMVLAAVLSLTGPVDVPDWPEPITADNAVEALLYEQYLRLDQAEGADFIDDAIHATFDRLQTSSLPAPARIAHTLAPMVQAQRLMLFSADAEEQALFEEMGVDGGVPSIAGDYFHVVTQNVGQSKIDWFQQRTVSYDVTHDPVTGQAEVVATVTITNHAPSGGESELLIGGTNFPEPGPLGRSRLYVDFYSPLDLQSATLDGQPVELAADRAYDRNLYWTLHTIPPGGSATFELRLTGVTGPPGPYVLELDTQPVVRPDAVEVTVRGRGDDAVATASGLQVEDGAAVARFEQHERRRFVALISP